MSGHHHTFQLLCTLIYYVWKNISDYEFHNNFEVVAKTDVGGGQETEY